MKATAGGWIYLHEQTPLICYAIPLLPHETYSFYYSENRFQMAVVTPKQRVAFRMWVRHYGKVLQDLKSLKLTMRLPILEPRYLYRVKNEYLTSNLPLNVEANRTMIIRHSCRYFYGCACWLVPYVEEDLRKSRSNMKCLEDADKEQLSSIANNPAIDFAPKFCRSLDLGEYRIDQIKCLGWFNRHGTSPCVRCGERTAISLTKYPRPTAAVLNTASGLFS